MKQPLSLFRATRLPYAAIAIISILLMSCGITSFAASSDAGAQPIRQAANELYPTDVQTVTENGVRQVIKTYSLTTGQSPNDIPTSSFTRDGCDYSLTDITESRPMVRDTRSHKETVVINTGTNELNEILKQLPPTIEYQSIDGYSGILALDLSSVKCEAEGYEKKSYTISATREYPNMSANDLSLIPKSITENGRVLQLDGVEWEAQNHTNVDYVDIPDSYRAVAKYTAGATRSVVTGYVTTADYSGETTREAAGEMVYAACFSESEPPRMFSSHLPPIIAFILAIALLLWSAAYFLPRYNVRVFSIGDDKRELIAKDRIGLKKPSIDLTPVKNRTSDECFRLEIEKLTAKKMNGKAVTITFASKSLQHIIAYEGNLYAIEADFSKDTIKAVYSNLKGGI